LVALEQLVGLPEFRRALRLVWAWLPFPLHDPFHDPSLAVLRPKVKLRRVLVPVVVPQLLVLALQLD
jgi:hypothetical protein